MERQATILKQLTTIQADFRPRLESLLATRKYSEYQEANSMFAEF
jgi:hypothetical protein